VTGVGGEDIQEGQRVRVFEGHPGGSLVRRGGAEDAGNGVELSYAIIHGRRNSPRPQRKVTVLTLV